MDHNKAKKQLQEETLTVLELPSDTIDRVARLVLREKLWCKFEARSMFVHFGSAQMCKAEIQKKKK